MSLNSMKPEIFIAVVELVRDDWTITFKIPNIIDNLKNYPTALPLCDHAFQLYKGDEVYIFNNGNALEGQFYYLPITIRRFTGLRYKGSFIDLTRDDILDVQSKYIYKFVDNEELRSLNSSDISDVKYISTNKLIIKLPVNDSNFETTKKTLNRSPGELKPKPGGEITIEMNPSGGININCSSNINITAADVVINGISFPNHTHTCTGIGSETTKPHNGE